MKRIIGKIDFHILVIGSSVTLLFVAIVSTMTFVPGPSRPLLSLTYGIVTLLVFLEPSILMRVYDGRERGDEVLTYFIVNSLLAIIFGLVCGFWLFAVLPLQPHDQVFFEIAFPAFLPS